MSYQDQKVEKTKSKFWYEKTKKIDMWYRKRQYQNEDLLYKVLFDKINRPNLFNYAINHEKYQFPKNEK